MHRRNFFQKGKDTIGGKEFKSVRHQILATLLPATTQAADPGELCGFFRRLIETHVLPAANKAPHLVRHRLIYQDGGGEETKGLVVYAVGGIPIVFGEASRGTTTFHPTVFLFCHLFRCLCGEAKAEDVDGLLNWFVASLGVIVSVQSPATNFLLNGADLMNPGVTAVEGTVIDGAFATICVGATHLPFAVGHATSILAAGSRGKGVNVVHCLGDDLCAAFDSVALNLGFPFTIVDGMVRLISIIPPSQQHCKEDESLGEEGHHVAQQIDPQDALVNEAAQQCKDVDEMHAADADELDRGKIEDETTDDVPLEAEAARARLHHCVLRACADVLALGPSALPMPLAQFVGCHLHSASPTFKEDLKAAGVKKVTKFLEEYCPVQRADEGSSDEWALQLDGIFAASADGGVATLDAKYSGGSVVHMVSSINKAHSEIRRCRAESANVVETSSGDAASSAAMHFVITGVEVLYRAPRNWPVELCLVFFSDVHPPDALFPMIIEFERANEELNSETAAREATRRAMDGLSLKAISGNFRAFVNNFKPQMLRVDPQSPPQVNVGPISPLRFLPSSNRSGSMWLPLPNFIDSCVLRHLCPLHLVHRGVTDGTKGAEPLPASTLSYKGLPPGVHVVPLRTKNHMKTYVVGVEHYGFFDLNALAAEWRTELSSAVETGFPPSGKLPQQVSIIVSGSLGNRIHGILTHRLGIPKDLIIVSKKEG